MVDKSTEAMYPCLVDNRESDIDFNLQQFVPFSVTALSPLIIMHYSIVLNPLVHFIYQCMCYELIFLFIRKWSQNNFRCDNTYSKYSLVSLNRLYNTASEKLYYDFL